MTANRNPIFKNVAATYKYYGKYYNKSKVGDRSRGRPEGSLFNSYYPEM